MEPINRCAYLNEKHEFTIVEERVPVIRKDEVLVQILANGICGSDLHFYAEGRLGNFVVTGPYIPGHEASGVVIHAGTEVAAIQPGDRVVIEPGIPCGKCAPCKSGRYNLCASVVFLSAPPTNGTFCDFVAIRSDCVHKIPSGLTDAQAALVEPAAVAVHAVNRAGDVHGKVAAVIGAGPIGQLTMQAFRAAGGAGVVCVDRIDNRLRLARQLGAERTVNIEKDPDSLDNVADVVFETAGANVTTAALFRHARAGGQVVQVGWPAGNVVPMDISLLLDKELTYVGVNRYANAFPTAISWIADGRINVDALITHCYPLDRIAEAFRDSLAHPADVMKTVVLNG